MKSIKTLSDVVEIKRMFTVEHLTYRQIAKRVGISAGYVGVLLKSAGIDSKQGTWVDAICANCSRKFKQGRAKFRKSVRQYCTKGCYFESRKTTNYVPHRQGQYIARGVVSKLFPLPPGSVVHHEDGDNNNNDPRNLKVFASQSDHLKYHHVINQPIPLWDGSLYDQFMISSIQDLDDMRLVKN